MMARVSETNAVAAWTGELKITVYTDYKSPYAYLANGPIFQLAEEMSVTLVWRPYILDIPKYLGSARVDAAGTCWRKIAMPINGGVFGTAIWTAGVRRGSKA